jgi:hypothetical protein
VQRQNRPKPVRKLNYNFAKLGLACEATIPDAFFEPGG